MQSERANREAYGAVVSPKRPVPFSYADVKPYSVPDALDDLHGSERGVITLPHQAAWGGRREFDHDYDRAAMNKIVLEEGQESDQWRRRRR